ncbi:MAG TPA: MarR family transcriptional regulator [Baekduia sp.]|uniref:MarR family winged helix-turn-helix transcriptional regulator n=1 Tax=Baekduia sp. TaxID=2600305 RepID=UPI002D79F4C9|nr:MarR family transcriptional regulator [Baekduia sp.]HET6509568.1 MarR family transcriptional regulator [Baekduia sp.]
MTAATDAVAADDAQLAAFAQAFDDFVRAAKRARVRVEPDAVLTPSQHDLLCPLLDGALGLRELARTAGVSAPTATRMIDGLQERELVTRDRAADDRRAVRIALTAAGRDALKRHRTRQLARRRALFAQLSPGERRAAAKVLSRLAAAYEELEETQ